MFLGCVLRWLHHGFQCRCSQRDRHGGVPLQEGQQRLQDLEQVQVYPRHFSHRTAALCFFVHCCWWIVSTVCAVTFLSCLAFLSSLLVAAWSLILWPFHVLPPPQALVFDSEESAGVSEEIQGIFLSECSQPRIDLIGLAQSKDLCADTKMGVLTSSCLRLSQDQPTVVVDDLRLCTVKPSTENERRFCFEVVSPSKWVCVCVCVCVSGGGTCADVCWSDGGGFSSALSVRIRTSCERG